MPAHPWGASTPEMNAGVLETGSTSATWAAGSAAWMGLATAAMATMGIVAQQMGATLSTMSGVRSATHAAATPPFLAWLAGMAGIAFQRAAVNAVVAESYGLARTTMIPSVQSINNRVREHAAEASNIFGQNTPLIMALNAEYGVYTVDNATIGNTYGEVIAAATLPVPIPPPPPLGSAAQAAADAGQAAQQSAQLVAQAGNGALSQAASQSAAQAGQGAGSSGDMLSSMGQMGQMFQAPMQALQSAGSSLTSPFQSLTQLFSAPMSMFGSASGMGNLLGGGSTGNSFSPTSMAKAGGLPLGTNGLGGGGGVGLGGGGLGAYGGGLSGANKSGTSTMARTSVLSGVSTMTQERFAGAPAAGFGGGGIPPSAAARGDQGRRSDSSSAVLTFGPKEDEVVRRGAEGPERDLFN